MEEACKSWILDRVNSDLLPCGEILISQRGKVLVDFSHHKHPEPPTIALGGRRRSGDFGRADRPEIYRMYSMTKTVISALAMTFTEGEDKLDLNAPVWPLLGEAWKKENLRVLDVDSDAKFVAGEDYSTVPCETDITLYHLLTHTSGLSHGLYEDTFVDQIYASMGVAAKVVIELAPEVEGFASLSEFLAQLAKCPLAFQPGCGWLYSYSMELVSQVIEVKAGKPVQDVLQERFCSKLNMPNTTFFLSKEQEDSLCTVYYEERGHLHPFPTHFPKYAVCSAGLYSTTKDYFEFVSMLQRKGLSLAGERVLSEALANELLTNQLTLNGTTCTMYDLAHVVPQVAFPQFFGFGFGGEISIRSNEQNVSKVSEYSWAGATSTSFWIDQRNELVVVFMTSLLKSPDINVWNELHGVVNPNIPKLEPLEPVAALKPSEQKQQPAAEAKPKRAVPAPLKTSAFCSSGACSVM